MKQLMKVAGLSTAVLLGACSSDDDNDSASFVNNEVKAICEQTGTVFSAAIATKIDDSANVEIIQAGNGSCTIFPGQLPKDVTDFAVAAYGDSFYHIGRYNIDTIAKYKFSAPSINLYTSSTPGGEPGYALPLFANAYGLEFVSSTKAYMPLYGLDVFWNVNPSAGNETAFKTSEVKLNAYNGSDATPEAMAIKATADKVFVFMQRLNRNDGWSKEGSYVAVFDGNDLTQEIDTGKGEDALKGIKLPVQNPSSVDYHEDVGFLMTAVSDYHEPGKPRDAGIVKLNPDTYETTLLVGDEESDNAPVTVSAAFSNVAIADENNAFFSSYVGWKNNDLYHLDLQTNTATKIDVLSGLHISALKTDPLGNIWVGVSDAANPRIVVLSKTGSKIGEFALSQGPNSIAFAIQ